MLRLILSLLLNTFALAFIFNLMPGLHFTGDLMEAICHGSFLSLGAFAVSIGLLAFLATYGMSTGENRAVLMVFLYFVGYWLIPAIQLELLAWWYPEHLSVDGFGYAIQGSLVLLMINLITKQDWQFGS